jgi:hypothetical protein
MHQLMHASMRCSCCIPSHTLWTLRVCLSEPAPLDSEHSASPMCASAAAVKPIGPWRLCSMPWWPYRVSWSRAQVLNRIAPAQSLPV